MEVIASMKMPHVKFKNFVPLIVIGKKSICNFMNNNVSLGYIVVLSLIIIWPTYR